MERCCPVNFISVIPANDSMDGGGRATQEAKAEAKIQNVIETTRLFAALTLGPTFAGMTRGYYKFLCL